LLIYCLPSDSDEPPKKPVRRVAALTESNRGDVNRPQQDYVRRDDNHGYGAPRFDRGDEGGRGAPMRCGGGGGELPRARRSTGRWARRTAQTRGICCRQLRVARQAGVREAFRERENVSVLCERLTP
jgi:hypothetical protein